MTTSVRRWPRCCFWWYGRRRRRRRKRGLWGCGIWSRWNSQFAVVCIIRPSVNISISISIIIIIIISVFVEIAMTLHRARSPAPVRKENLRETKSLNIPRPCGNAVTEEGTSRAGVGFRGTFLEVVGLEVMGAGKAEVFGAGGLAGKGLVLVFLLACFFFDRADGSIDDCRVPSIGFGRNGWWRGRRNRGSIGVKRWGIIHHARLTNSIASVASVVGCFRGNGREMRIPSPIHGTRVHRHRPPRYCKAWRCERR